MFELVPYETLFLMCLSISFSPSSPSLSLSLENQTHTLQVLATYAPWHTWSRMNTQINVANKQTNMLRDLSLSMFVCLLHLFVTTNKKLYFYLFVYLFVTTNKSSLLFLVSLAVGEQWLFLLPLTFVTHKDTT